MLEPEVVPENVKRLIDTLDRLGCGDALPEFADRFRAVLDATNETQKAGEVRLVIKISAPKTVKDAMKQDFSVDIQEKCPRPSLEKVSLFVGNDGWPTHNHPRQTEINLRETKPEEPRKIRDNVTNMKIKE